MALEDEWTRAVGRAGVADVQSARVPGFPFLRANRFLASQRGVDASEERERTWIGALRSLDREARRYELRNLPDSERNALAEKASRPPAEAAERCGQLEVERLLASPARRAELRASAQVPDAYEPAARVLGLYPVTSTFFLTGVERLHRDFRVVFATPLEDLPVEGRLVRFAPPISAAASDGARYGGEWTVDALGVPRPDEGSLQALFARHAPVWEVDVAVEDDRIGAPSWTNDGPGVDVARPVVYRKASYVRLQGRSLLQLSYVVWFPSRPPAPGVDILAGRLDGITWRVTLDADGQPLLYDAMHNCGCYHMYFPTERLAPVVERRLNEEPLLVPEVVAAGQGRVVLRIAHRTHHIQRVYRGPGNGETVHYALEDYDTLRSLALPGGGRRSLFGPDGLVAGTERGERWLFWPMGVRSPGAMRQWGHHAVAFVGRRHFDDPGLLERYFYRVP